MGTRGDSLPALKYSCPVLFLMLSPTHHTKFVRKPPTSTTASFGRPCQRVEVPCFKASALMGSPAVRPNEKPALMTPEKMATRTPFLKLNSLMEACFCSADISFSLDMPALPTKAMPARQ